MITSDTSSGATPARSSASAIATLPSSDASAKAPLNAPTGVRAAAAMTMSVMWVSSVGWVGRVGI